MLLSDDRRNREIAGSEGLLATSTKDYVDGLVGDVREALVDLVVGGVDDIDPSERRGRRIYDDVSFSIDGRGRAHWQYLSQDVLNAGIKTGRFHQGFFNASQYNYLEVSRRQRLRLGLNI